LLIFVIRVQHKLLLLFISEALSRQLLAVRLCSFCSCKLNFTLVFAQEIKETKYNRRIINIIIIIIMYSPSSIICN
jgi:hypothetical protein